MRFPKQGLSLELENRVLAIYVDYTLKEIKPELKLQHFNGRSRVMSFDISDSKSLMKTENSSETTPPRRRIMSVISSLGIHEDSESGIKLIASIYDSNSESESSESNAFQNNSFEMNFGSNHLEEDNDSIVALYLKKCEKLSKNSLFVGTNSVLIETNNLVKYWKQKFI